MSDQPFRSSFSVAALAGATATALAFAPATMAHDVVLASNPDNGGVIDEFPQRIELEFSGEIQEGFNTVALSRQDAGNTEVLFSGEPNIEGRDVTMDLPADIDAQPGEYRVGFQIISSDGHSTKGMTQFTYDPDGTLSAGGEVANAGEDGEAPSSHTLSLLLAGLAVIVAAGAIAWARSRRSATAKSQPRKSQPRKSQPRSAAQHHGDTTN